MYDRGNLEPTFPPQCDKFKSIFLLFLTLLFFKIPTRRVIGFSFCKSNPCWVLSFDVAGYRICTLFDPGTGSWLSAHKNVQH